MVRLFPGTGALLLNVTSCFTGLAIERTRLDRATMPPPDRLPPWRLRPRRSQPPPPQQPQQPPPPPQHLPHPPPDMEEGYEQAASVIVDYLIHRHVCHPYVQALYEEAMIRIQVICEVHFMALFSREPDQRQVRRRGRGRGTRRPLATAYGRPSFFIGERNVLQYNFLNVIRSVHQVIACLE